MSCISRGGSCQNSFPLQKEGWNASPLHSGKASSQYVNKTIKLYILSCSLGSPYKRMDSFPLSCSLWKKGLERFNFTPQSRKCVQQWGYESMLYLWWGWRGLRIGQGLLHWERQRKVQDQFGGCNPAPSWLGGPRCLQIEKAIHESSVVQFCNVVFHGEFAQWLFLPGTTAGLP